MAIVQNCQAACDLHESSQQQYWIDTLVVQITFDYFALSIDWLKRKTTGNHVVLHHKYRGHGFNGKL